MQYQISAIILTGIKFLEQFLLSRDTTHMENLKKISMEQLMPYSEVISDRQVPRRPVPLERPHNYTWNTNYHRAALAFPTQRLPLTHSLSYCFLD